MARPQFGTGASPARGEEKSAGVGRWVSPVPFGGGPASQYQYESFVVMLCLFSIFPTAGGWPKARQIGGRARARAQRARGRGRGNVKLIF